MRKESRLALLAALTLVACSGASPAPPPRPPPAAKVIAPAPVAEPTTPPPPLSRFGTFPEDAEVQLFALRGTPLLRVDARIYSLRADRAKREPGLEKVLFDAAGKPWWHVLAGAFPGDLYADRAAPRASASDWPDVEVVQVTEAGTRVLGRLEKASGVAHRLVPLPDGRVVVTLRHGDGLQSAIVPAADDDRRLLQPCVFYGEAARFADGTVALPCRERRGGESVITLRPGAAPTIEPVEIEELSRLEFFASPGGALYASSDGGLYSRRGVGWVKVDETAPGLAEAALRLHLERARPGGRTPVELTLHGHRLQVPAFGFAHDPEGGVWALADSGLGLFHDRAPDRLVELAPARRPAAPIATHLPEPTAATASEPDAPLVQVLDATPYRRKGEDDGPELRIHPVVGRTFVSIDDQLLYIDGDTLKSDPMLQRGFGDRPPAWGRDILGAIGGRFPESAWLPVTDLGERGNSVSLLRWTEDGWTRTLESAEYGKADRVYPLAGGWSILQSLRGGFAYRYGPGIDLSLLHDDVASKVVGAGLMGIDGGSEPRVVATSPDGTLIVGLVDRVAAWAPDGTPRPIPPIPSGTTPYGLVARSAAELYVLLHPAMARLPEDAHIMDVVEAEDAAADPPPGDQRLLRYDGESWTSEVLPPHAARVEQLMLGPRGSLWVTQAKSSEVLVRSSSGAWSSMRAPAHLDAVWVAPGGDVWAVAGTKLLHTRPLPRGFDLAAVLPPRDIQQWGPHCGPVAVLIHEVPRTAPKDASFAATIEQLRPALGALAEKAAYYEITSGGRRSLVVVVDDPETSSDARDREMASAAAVMKLAAAKVPGAKPRLVCPPLTDKKLRLGVQSLRAVGAAAAKPVAK